MIKVKKKLLKSEKQLHFETPVDWTARMPVITATFVSNREKKTHPLMFFSMLPKYSISS